MHENYPGKKSKKSNNHLQSATFLSSNTRLILNNSQVTVETFTDNNNSLQIM